MKKKNQMIKKDDQSIVPRYPPSSKLYKIAKFFPTIEPIPALKIDPEFQHLPWYEQVTETIRYSIRKLEFGLSPRGHLRWWTKLNFLLFLFIAIPVLLFMPVILYVVGAVTSISTMLLTIVTNVLGIVFGIAMLTALIGFFLWIFRR